MPAFGLGAIGAVTVATVGMLAADVQAVPAPQDQGDDILNAFDEGQGQAALDEARRHLEAGSYGKARDAYAEALRFMPGNQEALQGLREAETLLDQGSPIQDVAETTEVLREQARIEFDQSMRRSQELLGQGDYNGALQEALTAQIRLRQNRNLFQVSEFNQKNQQAETQLAQIDSEQEKFRLQQEQIKRSEAETRRDEQAADEERRIANEIAERVRRVRHLQQAQKYEEALQVIDEILFQDELNVDRSRCFAI